jgi:hypothetical protein
MNLTTTYFVIVDFNQIDSNCSENLLDTFIENASFTNEREALKELDLLLKFNDNNTANLGVLKITKTLSYTKIT